MMTKRPTIFLSFYFAFHLCCGQTNILDSCGVDTKPLLNKYEIKVIDSVLFAPIQTKKQIIDRKDGFEFNEKKIAFYSCFTEDFLSKSEFFKLFKPAFKGHAGNGLMRFNENEKKESNGFDAVIVIDCPYDFLRPKDLIPKLVKQHKQERL